jgi:hypothetical protein
MGNSGALRCSAPAGDDRVKVDQQSGDTDLLLVIDYLLLAI